MKVRVVLSIATALIFGVGCQGRKDSVVDAGRLRAELMAVDREFSQMSVEKGRRAAFDHYMAEDARMIKEGMPIVRGRDAIMELFPEDAPGRLEWEPYLADAAESGDFGYTLGEWIFTAVDSAGDESITTGNYVTIWRRSSDGSWRWVFDTGSPEATK